MKVYRFGVMCFLMATFSAFAQNSPSDTISKDIREFMYPVYFYNQGMFYGQTSFLHFSGEADISVDNIDVAETDVSSSYIAQSLFYGVRDGLAIGLGVRYQLQDQVRVTFDLGSFRDEKLNSSGLEDPKIEAHYQIPFGTQFLTTEFLYSPRLIKQERAQGSERGNAAKGKHLVSVKADYSSVGTIFWGSAAKLTYHGEEKSTGADNDVEETTKPYLVLECEGRLGWASGSRDLYPYIGLILSQTPETKSKLDEVDATEEKTTHDLDVSLLFSVPYLAREDIKTEFSLLMAFPGNSKTGDLKTDPATSYAFNFAATYTF